MRTAARSCTTRARARRVATVRRRAVAAAASSAASGWAWGAALALAVAPSHARADSPTAEPVGLSTEAAQSISDTQILGARGSTLHIESIMTRVTSYDQFGHGYQSQAGPVLGRGS